MHEKCLQGHTQWFPLQDTIIVVEIIKGPFNLNSNILLQCRCIHDLFWIKKNQLADRPRGNFNNLGTKRYQQMRGKETCEVEKMEFKTNSCGVSQLGDTDYLEIGGC